MEVDKPVTDASSLNKSACGTVFHSRSHKEKRISKFCHTLTISNFSFFEDQVVSSGAFSDGTNEEIKWYLEVRPWDDTYRDLGDFDVSLGLLFESSVISKLTIKVKFSIVNDKQENMYSQERECTIKNNERCVASFDRRSLFDHQNELLPNDTLKACCEVIIVGDTVNVPIMDSASHLKNWKSSLSEKFELMFDTQQFSDVTVVSGDRELKAHKMILAANSSVFSAMFRHDMEERKLNCVNIKDTEGHVVEEMLRFMYSGKVKNMETMADSLLVAANKYGIDSLKLMCQVQLCDSITNENVSDILILADLHNAKELKAQAIHYIYMHTSDVFDTPSFKLAQTSHPSLIMETLQTLTIWRQRGPDESALSVAN